MFTISKDDVSPVEGKPELVTEASTAGFAPGQWPEVVAVLDTEGEGFIFFFQGVMQQNDDVLLATYTTLNGRFILTVLND